VLVMAELDYAFIAEFAKVENGKLTAVGASYLDVRAHRREPRPGDHWNESGT